MSILLHELVFQEGQLVLSFSLKKLDKKYLEYNVLVNVTKTKIAGEKWVGQVSNQNIGSGVSFTMRLS